MTEQEFFALIEEQQKKSHDLLVDKGDYNIVRGMAHVAAGFVEDLFAVYMANKIGDKRIHYLVDKVISFNEEGSTKAKSFKPDLFASSTRGEYMTHYFDVKTNLGWNRDIETYLKEKNEFVKSIRGKNGWIHFNGDKPWELQFDPNLKYQIVVIWGGNVNEDLLEKNMEIARSLDAVEMYVLRDKNKGINKSEFDRLNEDSKKQVKVDEV